MNEEILNEQTEEQQMCGSDVQENEETDTSISEQTEEPAQEPSLEQQLNETKDKYLRLAAEFDNFRRRTSKEKLEFIAVAAEDTILAFLPVVDDLERAIKVLDEDAREGIELIYQKFLKILAARGVESLDVIDKPFNEEISEAVARIPAPCNDKAGIVIDVVQKGYKMHGKIIRYAKVVVGEQ